jgi:hypothetical protein
MLQSRKHFNGRRQKLHEQAPFLLIPVENFWQTRGKLSVDVREVKLMGGKFQTRETAIVFLSSLIFHVLSRVNEDEKMGNII